ncbi:MAG: helix-turn-helix transcriptional regulator [Alphaproteobacteria bacterium]|nr:helix-turn-helix transcriptional regulator [Alphaproteobacteria bacterium]
MTPAQLAQIVRNARRALNLRQDQLAGAANVGLRFIVDLERGKPTVQLGKTLAVLEALGVDVGLAPPSGVRNPR